MSITEFAMVQELAYLVKDNLASKHLVLSMEETFINFIHRDDDDAASLEEVLELKPMSSYDRLLLHRLADIFGFVHESVGEGDDRHLIIKRGPETSMPSILVNDILWQYDNEPQSLMESNQLLRRNHTTPALNAKRPSSQNTFEDREAAYMAARERIFATDGEHIRDPVKQNPRNIPVVARRMIAHALKQRIDIFDVTVGECQSEGEANNLNRHKARVDTSSCLESSQENITQAGRNPNTSCDVKNIGSSLVTKVPQEPASIPPIARNKNGVKKDLKEENAGAAKRMFTRALGLSLTKSSPRCNKVEQCPKDNFNG